MGVAGGVRCKAPTQEEEKAEYDKERADGKGRRIVLWLAVRGIGLWIRGSKARLIHGRRWTGERGGLQGRKIGGDDGSRLSAGASAFGRHARSTSRRITA